MTVRERPSWLELERGHWEAARAVQPNGDAGLAALREEAEEMLPLLPLLRRVLATAVAPAAHGCGQKARSHRPVGQQL